MAVMREQLLRRIFDTDDLAELKSYLSEADEVRELLFAEFINHACYSDAAEWNKAVRLCECLAITGWGDHEALEAHRGTYVNGYPNTFFVNARREPRFLEAVWQKNSEGTGIWSNGSMFHKSPDDPYQRDTTSDPEHVARRSMDEQLKSQRNWIAKNPVVVTRALDNCYQNSRSVIDSIDQDLQPALDREMRPELYGTDLNRIVINCAFSFNDGPHCMTNYIIADEHKRLSYDGLYRELLAMLSEGEIEENGYYLRYRYNIGPFRKSTGSVNATVVFEKEFSELSHHEQKERMMEYFLTVADRLALRQKNKLDYDFGLMRTDMERILINWVNDKTSNQK